MRRLTTNSLPGHIVDQMIELVRESLQGVRVTEQEFNRLAYETKSAMVKLRTLDIDLHYILECDPKGDTI